MRFMIKNLVHQITQWEHENYENNEKEYQFNPILIRDVEKSAYCIYLRTTLHYSK